MSEELHIIELSDHNIRVSKPAEILVQSPGFANIAHNTPIFGDNAQQQSRLHPRQSFNQFWSQLSLDPLVNSNKHFRHQADMAYGHLNDLANIHNLVGEVILAVPSNYNRDQLAILLGLIKQCPFDAVGLIDIALLSTVNAETNKATKHPSQALFIDIQLHQTVITTLLNDAGQLSKSKVLQIPASGLLALHDSWANMISDAFIKQCRFDPQHNAETEQYVYNQLKPWLAQAMQNNEVELEINNKGAIYQAKLNLRDFKQRTREIFTRIKHEVDSILSPDTSIYMPDNMAVLPGLKHHLHNIVALDERVPINNCLSNLAHLKGEIGSLGLTSKLPITLNNSQSKASITPQPASTIPTHFLLKHSAYAMSDNAAIPAELNFSLQPQGYVLQQDSTHELLLNGEPVKADTLLQLGDTLDILSADTTMTFIQVT